MVMAGAGGARSLSVILTLQDRFTKQMRVARGEVDKFGATTARHTKAIDEGFKKNEVSVTKFLLALRRNFLAVTAVIGSSIALAAMFISASRDHARSVTVLDGALQSIGTSWDEQKEKIEALMRVLGGSTGATEGTLLGALTTLVLETGNLELAMKLLEPALGLAARTGINVSDAAKLIADTMKGDEGAVKKLKEYGFAIDDSATAGERLNEILEFTEGWAQKNNDAISQMNVKWDEMKRVVGEELMPTLEPLLDLFIDMAPAISALFTVIIGQIKLILAPLTLLKETIEAVKRLLGVDDEGAHDRNAGASRTFGRDADEINATAPPSLLPGPQIPWVPNDPWAGVGEQPSGIIGQGMSVTIVSNGDIDFERRVTNQLDSIYRSGWRPN